MKKEMNAKSFIRNHRKPCIILAVLLVFVIAVSAFAARAEKARNAFMEGMNTMQTARAERRTIVESISASGSVTSSESKSITVAVSDIEVESVSVNVGDTVQAGDVICVMDSEDVEENLENARKSLNAAASKSSLEITSAQRQLNEAVTAKSIDLQRADRDVSDAYRDYENAVKEMENANDILEDAEEETQAKKTAYESALTAYQSAAGGIVSGNDAGHPELMSRLEQAQNAYQTAREAETRARSAYESAKDKANSLYDTYVKQTENRDDKERSDNSSVSSRQENLQSSRIGASTSGISERQQVENYEQQLENCTVTAPISGVVTQLNVEAGDIYKGSVIGVIENVASYKVTAENVLSVPYESVQEDEEGNYYIEVVDEDRQVQGAAPGDTDTPDSSADRDKEGMPGTGRPGTGMPGTMTRRIYVTKGIESDYYIEIISDEVTEGMEVIVPVSDTGMDAQDMIMRQGPMGGF